MRWDFEYTRDEPPVVQRHTDEPRHSTPRADQRTPIERPRPALELPRPRASSAPPTSHPAKRVALNYVPVTEEIIPPVTPPRAQTKEIDTATETIPETPSPIRGGAGDVAHGAHPRRLPQEWGRTAKRGLQNSRNATPRRHRLPTLVGLHLQMLQ